MASVLDVVADLRETHLPGLRIGMLHGRLPAEVNDLRQPRLARSNPRSVSRR